MNNPNPGQLGSPPPPPIPTPTPGAPGLFQPNIPHPDPSIPMTPAIMQAGPVLQEPQGYPPETLNQRPDLPSGNNPYMKPSQ
ncbi:cyclin-K-like [Pecten maximus]|uniref:cyclin-K-like n=1 Tax=Pecten maximus TaxID=6579 RepID=UPI001458B417|nr:cyclin-K-like [Pecten maximus]XP_033761256.1 cyclin-K-like [Pecten maximus]XP_033761257.1 cyclin-K-like [Pecten maximus]